MYRETEVSLDAFQKILQMPREPRPSNPVPLSDLRRLTFDHVTFQHQSATAPALTDISFEVTRGDTIAFVGPSGAGKTTLVKLLVGFIRHSLATSGTTTTARRRSTSISCVNRSDS